MSQETVRLAWFIDGAKVSAYLLNPDHPVGRSKAKYLLGFGFSLDAPKVLSEALVDHAMGNLPGVVVSQPKGPDRVVFEGAVTAPDGRKMRLGTVWEPGHLQMRFITAVPLTR